MSRRVLVAGLGNIFLGDDGFGVEVARRLSSEALPEGVTVEDFGIRGLHLAYELTNAYDLAILIDAAARGGEPGSVYAIEPDRTVGSAPPEAAATLLDAHGMQPDVVLQLLRVLGGRVQRVVVVGCEPGQLDEGIGLSPPVARAVDQAVSMVRDLLNATLARRTSTG